MFRTAAFAGILGLLASTASAQTFQTVAPFAYMKDLSTDTVLYSKGADEQIPPASMAKMMTVYVVFDMIKRGQIKKEQLIRVRPETWQKWHGPAAGSTMFLSPDEQVSVANLLHGIVTLSGNDACVVLAEGVAGTEAEFAATMNRVAKKIGLKNSFFTNSTGWPDPAEYVSPRDLAIIAERTILDFPALYKEFYGQPSFTWGKTMGSGQPITQGNRNPILGRVSGADGLKTGHTEAAGYGFTGSAEQNGRRLVMVLAGLTSMNERIEQSVAFMDWGFRAFDAVTVLPKGKVIQQAAVANGAVDAVGLTGMGDIKVTVPRSARADLKVQVRYLGPIKAPIAKGQKIATLTISGPGMLPRNVPLVAAASVEKAGFFRRVSKGFQSLFGAEPAVAPAP